MIRTKFDIFSQKIDSLIETNEWRHFTTDLLKGYLYSNLRIIIEQTQNSSHAADLQKKLLKLSHVINDQFPNNPSAHNLAFEIMGIAQGIFSKEEDKKDYLSQLPLEIRQKIYAELVASRKDRFQFNHFSGLETVRLVSKTEFSITEKNKIAWINNEYISLKACGYQTIEEAIHYIKKNRIKIFSANLLEFEDLTNEHLKELQECTWIQHLFICSSKITHEGLFFLKNLPLQTVAFNNCRLLTDSALENLWGMPLKSVSFSNCFLLTDKALAYLKYMQLPLQNVDFSGCKQLTDVGIEYLKEMPLQSVNFESCDLLTDKALEYLNGMQLQSVNFNYCSRLTDKALEYLRKMPLQSMEFLNCRLLTDKALENLKGMPLQNVNFSYCSLLTDNAIEYLYGMPLQTVKFCVCPLLTDKALEYLKGLPLRNIHFNYCNNLTDNAFEYLIEMPLQNVSIMGCKQLTEAAVKNFWQHFYSFGFRLNILH